MSAFLRLKRKEMEDGEPNLVPIMNMFLVIIPFLLMSASFYQIKAVNTSIPVLSSGGEDKADEDNLSA
jgi:biopolymer transport protein ExbD